MNELLRFTIDGAKVVAECAPNSRVHWRTRYNAEATAKKQAIVACKQAMGTATVAAPITLTCERYYAGNAKAFDEDALPATFKPAIDGIKRALGIDDNPTSMHIICKQFRASTNKLTFTVEAS